MIGEKVFQGVHGYFSPCAADQSAHPFQPRPRVRQEIVFKVSKLATKVVIGMDDSIRAFVMICGDTLRSDLDVGNYPVSICKDEVTRGADSLSLQQFNGLLHRPLLKKNPFEGVMRHSRLPLETVKRV